MLSESVFSKLDANESDTNRSVIKQDSAVNQDNALTNIVRIGHQGTLLDKSYYPVFEALYGSHGYKVQWVKVPVERSLVEIDSGNLDANLFSAELSKRISSNSYYLLSDMFDIDFIVMCSAKILCSKEALFNEQATFIGPSISERIKSRLGYSFRFEQVEEVNNFIKIISTGHYDYALALANKAFYSILEDNVRYFKIEKIKMHHTISHHRRDLYLALTEE